MNQKPLVSVLCATYNHELYISDAIESFLMQKTNFPIEIVIGEDCSTDRTREICLKYQEQYPNKIKLILREKNLGAMKNHLGAMAICSGKYIANCEGDDYWIDPYKLQKQVDYMEVHPECSLIWHAVTVINQKRQTNLTVRFANRNIVVDQKKIFSSIYRLGTSSLLFQTEMVKNLPEWFYLSEVGDRPLALLLASKGSVVYLNDVMSVYRKGTPNSWSDKTSKKTMSEQKKHWNNSFIILNYFDEYTNGKYKKYLFIQKLAIVKKAIACNENFMERLETLTKAADWNFFYQNLAIFNKIKLLTYCFYSSFRKLVSKRKKHLVNFFNKII